MDETARRRVIELLARATRAEMADGAATLGPLPAAIDLRVPETGLVLLRGRIGGDGAPFNVGEALVSRAAVQLDGGEVGIGYRLGRDREAARMAAHLEALCQRSAWAARIEEAVLAPVRRRLAEDRRARTSAVAGTKVEFFTVARGGE